MNQKYIVLLLCVSSVLGLTSLAESSEIDQKTREMLEAIIAGHRSNRAKILNLSMSGKILTIRGEGENQEEEEIVYNYYELGEKRRTDQTYTKGAKRIEVVGYTKHLVFTGKNTFSYHAGYGPGKTTAFVDKPGEYHLLSQLTPLDTLEVSPNWSSNIEHIERLLERGWNPQKQTIRVKSVKHEGKVLLQVHYESTRGGGLVKYTWTFDPQHGYEIV